MSLGLTRTDLRFLVHSGLVEHRVEVSLLDEFSIAAVDQQDRAFLPPDPAQQVCVRSAFCLSDVGIARVRQLFDRSQSAVDVQDSSPEVMLSETESSVTIPEWDGAHRQLLYQKKVVKWFKASARNQLLVLETFHEESWPDRVDDPLPPAAEIDCKQRLHDTIKSLNRRQLNPLLRFKGDGRGEGICWYCT